ncbi:hypothetical protein DMH04_48045 [Kibdelosporangium aridum]|uniref:Uncharacterized protein n=1 Tax=Kibdelosporangium aridum TaxID=2030 RepID=A0A428YJM4_KIBAR|nr:hypothetical protein DMH04_48045 [Kibdelosporangium aridum]
MNLGVLCRQRHGSSRGVVGRERGRRCSRESPDHGVRSVDLPRDTALPCYGWVGGSGTTSRIVPGTGKIAIVLTQVAMSGLVPPQITQDFGVPMPDRPCVCRD